MSVPYYDYLDSPIGKLLLTSDGNALTSIGFPRGKAKRRHLPHWTHRPTLFTAVRDQLMAYFQGELQVFDLPLAPAGTTFQQAVWDALLSIPYGETTSYGELARQIGKPRASRAVGAANGRNPIPIIIPCHRVIGMNGKLVGFGGGLETKKRLLAIEQAHQAPQLAF